MFNNDMLTRKIRDPKIEVVIEQKMCDLVLRDLGFMTSGYSRMLGNVPFYIATGSSPSISQFLWAQSEDDTSPWY